MGLSGFQTWISNTLLPAYNLFKTSFDAWKNPAERTKLRIAALQDAEDTFKLQYRHLYVGILKENPLVTNVDLTAMGLPERSDGERHDAVIPKTSPVATVKLPGPGIIEIHFRDGSVDNASHAKPYLVHGAEIRWIVSDTPPLNWEELIHSSFDTASPFRLTFDGDQRGRRIYFALRWENTRGEKGPWSEIQDAIIP
jgi:hypothetical protein